MQTNVLGFDVCQERFFCIIQRIPEERRGEEVREGRHRAKGTGGGRSEGIKRYGETYTEADGKRREKKEVIKKQIRRNDDRQKYWKEDVKGSYDRVGT